MTAPTPRQAGEWNDLLAAVPYLVSFQATDATVLIGQRDHRRVITATMSTPPPEVELPDVFTTLDEVVEGLRQHGAESVVIVGYGFLGPQDALLAAATLWARRAGITVDAVLRVEDGRYFCRCADAECPDRDGVAIEPDRSTIPAEAVAAGIMPGADLSAARALVVPQDTATDEALAVRGRAEDRLMDLLIGERPDPDDGVHARAAAAVAVADAYAALGAGRVVTDEEAVWLCILMDHPAARAMILADIDDRPEHLRLWCEVTRRAPADLAVGAALCAAVAAGRQSNHLLTAVALGVVLAREPDNEHARALASLLQSGLPPADLRKMQAALRPN